MRLLQTIVPMPVAGQPLLRLEWQPSCFCRQPASAEDQKSVESAQLDRETWAEEERLPREVHGLVSSARNQRERPAFSCFSRTTRMSVAGPLLGDADCPSANTRRESGGGHSRTRKTSTVRASASCGDYVANPLSSCEPARLATMRPPSFR